MKKTSSGLLLFFLVVLFFIAAPAFIFQMYWLLWLALLPIGGSLMLAGNIFPAASPEARAGEGSVSRSSRPTAKAAALFALSFPLSILVLTLWRQAWYLSLYLPFGVLTALAVDFMAALPAGRLKIDPRLPRRLHVGRTEPAEIILEAAGWDKPTRLEAILELEGEVRPPEPASGELSPGGLTLKLPIHPERRGRVKVEALWLRWKGPLGLVERKIRLGSGWTIDVIPDVRGVHEAALQFFARDAIYGVKAQTFKGEGTEFENLCDYAQGMDSRFIDWKHSARHRKLLCKEFRQERNHQIVLGFDTGHLMLEPINGLPKLDHAIKAGLLLSWISLYHGDLVGGCGFDARLRSYLKPGRGMTHFGQFQKFSAALEYNTEETNFTLGLAELNSRLSRRALVVLFTEFVDSISAELLLESLQLMSRRHVVIFVTTKDPMLTRLQNAMPADFNLAAEAVLADGFLRERAIVLERVARMGIHCLNVPVEAISAALLNRYLLIKQRGLL